MDLAVTHIKETASRNQLVSGRPDPGSALSLRVRPDVSVTGDSVGVMTSMLREVGNIPYLDRNNKSRLPVSKGSGLRTTSKPEPSDRKIWGSKQFK